MQKLPYFSIRIRSVARGSIGLVILFLLTFVPQLSLGQQPVDGSGGMSSAQISHIITSFTTKELEFRRALNRYTFRRDALLHSLGMGGQITGENHRISFFTFEHRRNRFEK